MKVRLESLAVGSGRGQKAHQRPSGAAKSVTLAFSGRISPAAGRAPRGSGVAADHADTVATGGPRSPLIRSRIPEKTRRGGSIVGYTPETPRARPLAGRPRCSQVADVVRPSKTQPTAQRSTPTPVGRLKGLADCSEWMLTDIPHFERTSR